MPKKKAKIILYKEDIDDAEGFAQTSVKSAEVVDAFSVMQTDFEPAENTVQVNREGAFFVANLTDSEAKKLADSPEVEDVVDDIEVYALEQGNDDAFDAAALGDLELEPEDTEMLEEAASPPDWEADADAASPEQFNLMCQLEPSVQEADLELEQKLIEGAAEAASDQAQLSGIPKERLTKIIISVLKCLLAQKVSAEDVSAEEIEALLAAAGLGGPPAEALADAIMWNLQLTFTPQAWRYSRGNGVRVAVLDTGIESRHPDLRVFGGVSYVPGVRSWRDDQGHGTHCAGIIAAMLNGRGTVGVAPNARLYAVKVLNRRGSGQLSWILNGLMWCYRSGMHVASLSLGSNERTHDPRVYNRAYERAGRILRRRGILCVAAAGNRGGQPVGNPARCPSFMAVSAIDRRRRLASFSCIGPQVEICAPGVGILSTFPVNTYRQLSGTSMACPHISGVAALVKRRRPTWHGDRIRVHMMRTAIDLGRRGRDWFFGAGQVNAWRAVL
ncbi:MAG: S8 family peptidase [bacterium]